MEFDNRGIEKGLDVIHLGRALEMLRLGKRVSTYPMTIYSSSVNDMRPTDVITSVVTTRENERKNLPRLYDFDNALRSNQRRQPPLPRYGRK